MQYAKKLGSALVVAVALLAFIGSSTASATALYSGASKQGAGTKIESTGSNWVLKAGFATIQCNHSEIDGKTTNSGGSSETVEITLYLVTVSDCDSTIHFTKLGSWIIHHTSGSDDATITSVGTEVTVSKAGTSCTYGTPTATNVGTLSGGSPAAWGASASLTRVAGGFLCANPASWTASYSMSTPNPLHTTAS